MRILLLLLFISTQLNAQYCDCGIKTIRSKWPKSAEENNIYGIVEIKYKLTDSCIIIDTVIIKGLGYGCDEEAMRIFSQVSNYWNECKRKCGLCECKSEEIIYRVKFLSPDMETLANNVLDGLKCFLIRFRLL